jgi:hypothetical protein
VSFIKTSPDTFWRRVTIQTDNANNSKNHTKNCSQNGGAASRRKMAGLATLLNIPVPHLGIAVT